MGLITKSFDDAFDFVKTNYKSLIKNIFKINIFALLAVIVGYVAAFAAVSVSSVAGSTGILIGLVVALIVYLISLVAAGAISASSIELIHSTYQKRPFEGSISWAKNNWMRTFAYNLLNMLVAIILIVPAYLIMLFFFVGIASSSNSGTMLDSESGASLFANLLTAYLIFIVVLFAGMLLLLIWRWLTGLSTEEYYLSKKGLFASISSSIQLAKSNKLSTMGFGIASLFATLLLSIPLVILYYADIIIFYVLLALTAKAGFAIMVIVLGLFLLIAITLILLYAAFLMSVTLSLSYCFWLNITGQTAPMQPRVHIVAPPSMATKLEAPKLDPSTDKKSSKTSKSKKSK